MNRLLWCAITDADELVGMSYANVDASETEVEIGGLMVDPKMRGKGLGEILMRLPLAHFLMNEQPFSWPVTPKIITHTLRDNLMPRGIIDRVGFAIARNVIIPGSELPGLRTEADGNVHGIEFHLVIPDGIHSVADWLCAWSGTLSDGTSGKIQTLEGESLTDWAAAIRGMV